MAIVTFFTGVKEKAIQKKMDVKKQYNKSKSRLDEKYLAGDNPYNKKAEDYVRKREEDKDKKQLAKVRFLGFVTSIIAILETIPVFFTIMTWSALLILMVVLVVVIFTVLGFLKGLDTSCGYDESMDDKKSSSSSSESSSSVSAGDGVLAWTDEELASKGKSLSNYEKNMYRLGIVSNKVFSGTFGQKKFDSVGGGTEDKVLMALGLASIESSMVFFADETKGNIYTKAVKNNANKLGYGFMGLRPSEQLSTYYKAGTVSKIKKEYSIKVVSEVSYAPYALAISIGHQNGKLSTGVKNSANNASAKAAKIYGFTGDLKKYFQNMFLMFTMQHAYLSYHPELLENEAIYAAGILDVSSDTSGSKSFKNYVPKGATYSESYYRYSYTGARGLIKKSNSSVYMELNGKSLSKSLPDYALSKLSGAKKTAFDKAVNGAGANSMKGALSRGTAYSIGQSFYYGLNSYLMANKIEQTLASKMNITKKESKKEDKKEDKKDDKKEDKKETALIYNGLEMAQKGFMETINSVDVVNAKEDYKVVKTISNAESTAYLATCSGCSGRTALGIDVRGWTPNIVASDPRVIPLGTMIKIYLNDKFMGYYIAADTGGAIKGNIVDILVKDGSTASKWGRKHIKIEVLNKKFNGKDAVVKWLKANESSSNKGIPPVGKGVTDSGSTAESKAKDKSPYLTKKSNIYMVGDSLTVGVQKQMEKNFPNMVIDAKVGRQMAEADSIMKKAKNDKLFGDGVVIALGTNGDFKQALLESYIKMIPSDTPVVLVNTYNKLKWGDNVNRMLSKVAKKYDNVTLADWASVAKPEYISGDEVHHNATGQEVYTKFLTDILLKTKSLQDTGEEKEDSGGSAKPSSTSDDCEDEGKTDKKARKEDDDGDDGDKPSKVTPGNFKQTPGKSQVGNVYKISPEKMASSIGGYAPSLVKHFGKAYHLEKPNYASYKGYKDTRYGVPFYWQAAPFTVAVEGYGTIPFGNSLGYSFNRAGCFFYAHSYVMSAITGKLINPAEANVIIRYMGGATRDSGLATWTDMTSVYKPLGYKSKTVPTQSGWEEYKKVLKNKKGLVVYRTLGAPFATSKHFFVLNDYKKTSQGEFFHLYTSSHPNQSLDGQWYDASKSACTSRQATAKGCLWSTATEKTTIVYK